MSGDAVGELKVKIGVELDAEKAKRDSEDAGSDAGNLFAENFNDAAKSIGAFVAGIAATAAAGLAHIFGEGLQIDRQAAQLGLTTDEVQRFRYVAEQAGIEGDALGEAFGGLAQRASQAADSGGDAARRFTDLGIELTDSQGHLRSTTDLVLDAADALQTMGPGTEQTATAIALFGEKGRQLLPVLAQGRAGIQRMTDEFDDLGGGLDQHTIASITATTREFNRAKQAVMGALMPAVRFLIDGLKRLVEKTRPVIDRFKGLVENSHLVRAALISLGAAAAVAAGAMLVAFAPVALTIAAIVAGAVLLGLAIDDVVTTLEGGDSVIRRVTDGLLGVGATEAGVRALGEAWDGLSSVFAGLATSIGQAANGLSPVLEKFSAIKTVVDWLLDKIPELLGLFAESTTIGTAFTALRTVGAQQQRSEGAGTALGAQANAAISVARAGLMPATVSASPTATAAIASGNGASSSRTVNTRAQVVIQGLVEDATIQRRIRDGIQEGLEASHAQALDTLDRTGDQ